MKKKNSIIRAMVVGALSLSSLSCTDWLDVKMSDNIMENTLYSTNNGFLIALNGVYTGLKEVYVPDLSVGVIDVMAQYYNVTENIDHSYKVYAGYKYGESAFKTTSNNIWQKMYELIANVNTLLDHCDEPGSALRETHYAIVKGEALALRAMMHFDLLRLYGPAYSEATASVITIPYQDISKKEILPLLPAGEVLDKVIKDLEDAAAILKEGDPILTLGVQNAVPSDDGLDRYDFAYRQLRLNYYAVQALLARAYLWKGDKSKAYAIAKNEILDKITTEKLTVFPWATEKSVTDANKPDRLFSTEVFFSLYDQSRVSVWNSYFAGSLSISSRLTFVGSGLASADSKVATFYDDAANDWRRTFWNVVTAVDQSGNDEEEGGDTPGGDEENPDEEETPNVSSSLEFNKYADADNDAEFDGSETYRYMIPLIRLSEVYLIAAECTSDEAEAFGYINAIHTHRNCQSVSTQNGDLRTLITNEFAREVIGEGQLFFYYKRLGMTKLMSGTSAGQEFEMVTSNYVWPLPEIEIDKRD